MKYDYEFKLKICKDIENGMSYKVSSRIYGLGKRKIEYMYGLYRRYGPGVLKHNYIHWTRSQKHDAINRVLNGESIRSVSLDMAISSTGTLWRWIKEYSQNGYTIVERKRGRPPMKKSSAESKEIPVQDEYLKKLEQENLELKIENEYLKKLNALVQKRKAQQQKRKSS